MKVLTGNLFSQPNMPVVTLPTIVSATPLNYFQSRLIAWFKSDAGLSQTNNAPVTQWADQSSTGLILAPNGSGTVSPLFETGSKVGTGNGVVMGGSSGKFLQATTADTPLLKFVLGSPFCFAVAFTFGGPGASGIGEIFGFNRLGTTPNLGFLLGTFSSNVNLILTSGSASSYMFASSGVALTAGKSYIVVVTHDGSFTAAGTQIYINGVQATISVVNDALGSSQGNLAIQATGQNFQVGGGIYQGQNGGTSGGTASADTLGEILIINRGVTAAEISFLESYLDKRFGIY